jgi:two-component system, OmpR family, alkaline phosphatase synthesis response regulator PhoP
MNHMGAHVLVVEDEKHLADGLRFNLEAEGYRVETVGDGETALALLNSEGERFDLVVLDCMLPGIDGFAVASELRRAGRRIPVLMLTARSRPEDVLRGFESGADDYLPKPFELAILVARLRSLLRRSEWSSERTGFVEAGAAAARDAEPGAQRAGAPQPSETPNDRFSFDGRTIDFDALEIRARERTVRLTLMEAELLRYLVKHAGRAVSRKAMLEDVWGLREDTDTRAIDNFIVRLRKYIEDEPSRPRHLVTVRGIGYRFLPGPPAAQE